MSLLNPLSSPFEGHDMYELTNLAPASENGLMVQENRQEDPREVHAKDGSPPFRKLSEKQKSSLNALPSPIEGLEIHGFPNLVSTFDIGTIGKQDKQEASGEIQSEDIGSVGSTSLESKTNIPPQHGSDYNDADADADAEKWNESGPKLVSESGEQKLEREKSKAFIMHLEECKENVQRDLAIEEHPRISHAGCLVLFTKTALSDYRYVIKRILKGTIFSRVRPLIHFRKIFQHYVLRDKPFLNKPNNRLLTFTRLNTRTRFRKYKANKALSNLRNEQRKYRFFKISLLAQANFALVSHYL